MKSEISLAVNRNYYKAVVDRKSQTINRNKSGHSKMVSEKAIRVLHVHIFSRRCFRAPQQTNSSVLFRTEIDNMAFGEEMLGCWLTLRIIRITSDQLAHRKKIQLHVITLSQRWPICVSLGCDFLLQIKGKRCKKHETKRNLALPATLNQNLGNSARRKWAIAIFRVSDSVKFWYWKVQLKDAQRFILK